jgi:aconitate hydratase
MLLVVQDLAVEATRRDGSVVSFTARLRVDAPAEVEYVQAGGVLSLVLAQMLSP